MVCELLVPWFLKITVQPLPDKMDSHCSCDFGAFKLCFRVMTHPGYHCTDWFYRSHGDLYRGGTLTCCFAVHPKHDRTRAHAPKNVGESSLQSYLFRRRNSWLHLLPPPGALAVLVGDRKGFTPTSMRGPRWVAHPPTPHVSCCVRPTVLQIPPFEFLSNLIPQR